MKNNILATVLMNMSIYLIGTILIAGFLTIVKHYDQTLKNDDWTIVVLSTSWTTYCFCKCYMSVKDLIK